MPTNMKLIAVSLVAVAILGAIAVILAGIVLYYLPGKMPLGKKVMRYGAGIASIGLFGGGIAAAAVAERSDQMWLGLARMAVYAIAAIAITSIANRSGSDKS